MMSDRLINVGEDAAGLEATSFGGSLLRESCMKKDLVEEASESEALMAKHH